MNERIMELETKQALEFPHVSLEFKLEEIAVGELDGDATATLTIKNTVNNCSVELPFTDGFEINEFIDELRKFVERHQSAWEIS